MIKLKGKVRDSDRGMKALNKRLMQTSDLALKVGLVGEKANQQHGDSGFTNVQLGTVHEFGSANGVVPERSFIRATVDEKEEDIKAIGRRVIQGIISGKVTAQRGLEIMGLRVQADIVAKIRSGIKPELKPETVKRKGSSTPLIDSGQLVQAINFQVVKRKVVD
jgi:hypothetical protein